ncbi:Shedu immune nuclease family protein [Nocardiopsis sp. NPDC006198]|uniref:Shedu immune nuclease family protein n=1 Tax=Nocardiopsis sp. NPDC006198 TaxID=3154472 RepID=UPI00339FFB77
MQEWFPLPGIIEGWKMSKYIFESPGEPNEVTYASGRLTTRTYASRSFRTLFGRDAGHPSRYIYRVFDEENFIENEKWEWINTVISETPKGRKQIQLQVARESGAVRMLRIQKVPAGSSASKLETVLELNREQAARLIDMLRALGTIPIEGESSAYVDDQLIKDLFGDPDAVSRIYSKEPDRFKALIEADADAEDVIALKHRKNVVQTMQEWLRSEATFDLAAAEAGGPERAWQLTLEKNPWILGVGLGGQLFTSWDREKLGQTVVGRNIKNPGKIPDALLRTAGVIHSLAFAEIKHHRTKLVDSEYRSGCWNPSKELSGAVVQSQQTVHLACRELGDYLQDTSDEGEMLPSGTFLLRPRSFVIAGTLDQLTGSAGGVVSDKFRSFEMFRRNLHDPEVITFDELVARAEWHVEMSARFVESSD